MSKRDNNYRSDNKSNTEAQPNGWFDPRTYASNRDRFNNFDTQMADEYRGETSRDPGYRQYNENYNTRSSNNGNYGYTRGQDAHSGFPRHVDNENWRSGRNRSMDSGMYTDDSYGGSMDYNNRTGRRNNQDTYRGNNQYRSTQDNNNDRDWWDRTSDEIASWFGDDDAERRRRMDKMKGPHHGKGPKGYTRTDERIKDDIHEKLYHDSYLDASDIEVTVSECDVTLTGTVSSRNQKRRAEDISEDISGVKDVQNQLRVKRSESMTSGNDKYDYTNNNNN